MSYLYPNTCHRSTAFINNKHYTSVKDAWQNGLNPEYWRHGLVFSQGNEMNVTEHRVKDRLQFIRKRLLRAMFGNRYRDTEQYDIHLIQVREGYSQSFNQHFHVLLHVEGRHNWSDFRIAAKVRFLDILFLKDHGWEDEKPVHVDYDWKHGNHYHAYTTKSIRSSSINNLTIITH
jgi:hypothetical protein